MNQTPILSTETCAQSPEMPLVDLACTGMLSSSRRDQLNTQLLIKPKKRRAIFCHLLASPD